MMPKTPNIYKNKIWQYLFSYVEEILYNGGMKIELNNIDKVSTRYKCSSIISNKKFEIILLNNSTNTKIHKLSIQINKDINTISFNSTSYDNNEQIINKISNKLNINDLDNIKTANNIDIMIKNIKTIKQAQYLLKGIDKMIISILN